jgi:hypothetical protein
MRAAVGRVHARAEEMALSLHFTLRASLHASLSASLRASLPPSVRSSFTPSLPPFLPRWAAATDNREHCAPRGGVTRQGVVLTDLRHILIVNKFLSLSLYPVMDRLWYGDDPIQTKLAWVGWPGGGKLALFVNGH